mmetsp:Transcript_85338/g.204432  ORF Transcript_85338/g.204432 Transcript_85338/m.204432 type:complete len:272 (+) Transcript_85338:3693-4508(+)
MACSSASRALHWATLLATDWRLGVARAPSPQTGRVSAAFGTSRVSGLLSPSTSSDMSSSQGRTSASSAGTWSPVLSASGGASLAACSASGASSSDMSSSQGKASASGGSPQASCSVSSAFAGPSPRPCASSSAGACSLQAACSVSGASGMSSSDWSSSQGRAFSSSARGACSLQASCSVSRAWPASPLALASVSGGSLPSGTWQAERAVSVRRPMSSASKAAFSAACRCCSPPGPRLSRGVPPSEAEASLHRLRRPGLKMPASCEIMRSAA